jgi:hypothetical protein
MKHIAIFIIWFFCFPNLFSQNCNENFKDEKKFKEIYDYLASHAYNYTFDPPNDTLNGAFSSLTYPFNNYTYPNNANDAVREFGNLESVGNILESLIRMYEITHDKAYLIKAINKSIQLMNAKGGATAPSPHAWASGYFFSNTNG